jgi:hypothetical protein
MTMKKVFMALVLSASLVSAIPGLAQEKGKKPARPPEKAEMMQEMKPGMMQPPHGTMSGMQMWWNLGVMSQRLGQLLEETGEILRAGDLSPEAQKRLGDLTGQMGQMASQMFAPQGPEKQQQYMSQLQKLKENLEALEKPGKTGKGGK